MYELQSKNVVHIICSISHLTFEEVVCWIGMMCSKMFEDVWRHFGTEKYIDSNIYHGSMCDII